MCGNVKTGWALLLGEMGVLISSYYDKTAVSIAIAAVAMITAMFLTDILNVEERATKEDGRFMAGYSYFGAIGLAASATAHLGNSYNFIPDGEIHNVPVVVGIIILVTLASTILHRRGAFPQKVSNITGWSQIGTFGVMVGAIAAKNVWPWLWPNIGAITLLAGWITGMVLYFSTSKRPSGFIGFATMYIALATSICEIVDTYLRSTQFWFRSYFWLGMPVVLGLFLINAWINYCTVNGPPKIQYVKLDK